MEVFPGNNRIHPAHPMTDTMHMLHVLLLTYIYHLNWMTDLLLSHNILQTALSPSPGSRGCILHHILLSKK